MAHTEAATNDSSDCVTEANEFFTRESAVHREMSLNSSQKACVLFLLILPIFSWLKQDHVHFCLLLGLLVLTFLNPIKSNGIFPLTDNLMAAVREVTTNKPILLVAMSSAFVRSRTYVTHLDTILQEFLPLAFVTMIYHQYCVHNQQCIQLPILSLLSVYVQSTKQGIDGSSDFPDTVHVADYPSYPYVQIVLGFSLLANGKPSGRALILHLVGHVVWWLWMASSLHSTCVGSCRDDVIPIVIHSFFLILLHVWYVVHYLVVPTNPEKIKTESLVEFTGKTVEKSLLVNAVQDPDDYGCNCCGLQECEHKKNGWLRRLPWLDTLIVIAYEMVVLTLTIILLVLLGAFEPLGRFNTIYRSISHVLISTMLVAISICICIWSWVFYASKVSRSDKRFLLRFFTFCCVRVGLKALTDPNDKGGESSVEAYHALAWFFEIGIWLYTVNWPLKLPDLNIIGAMSIICGTVMANGTLVELRMALDSTASLYLLNIRSFSQINESRMGMIIIVGVIIGLCSGNGTDRSSMVAMVVAYLINMIGAANANVDDRT